MRRFDLDPRNYDFRNQNNPRLEPFQGYWPNAHDPLGPPRTLESHLVSPAYDSPSAAHSSVPEEPLRLAYQEPFEVARYYGVQPVALYAPYEPILPHVPVQPSEQTTSLPSPEELEHAEPLTYEDSVRARVMIEMALIDKSTIQADNVDDVLAPSMPAKLMRFAGGLDSLF
ncbi:MAG: hypothetical protein JXQ75_11370 [Phycisphaerae bacterium]|nr:hypothetical protein [Phycisphaerae bacterium]